MSKFRRLRRAAGAALGAAILASCATQPPQPPGPALPQQKAEEPQLEGVATAPEAEPAVQPERPSPQQEQPAEEQVEPAQQPPATGEEPAPEATGFQVSDELYVETFTRIEEVIGRVSATIAAKDYEGWKSWLSSEYVARTGSAEYLAEASQAPALAKAGIRLASLEDYFLNVVVPSRINARLDRIEFTDATHVKAVTVIGGQAYILYWLVFEDGGWKIGTW